MFTVSFFGSKSIDEKTKNKLKKLIYNTITEEKNIEFLVTCDGDFDAIVLQCLKEAKKELIYHAFYITCVLTSKSNNSSNEFSVFYDDANATFQKDEKLQKAINIINRSCICVFNLDDNSDYVQKALRYVKEIDKPYLNISDWA